ncbi:MAG: hypothetical protein AAFP02_17175, partial [Bacteroidota bacterium]
IGPIFKTLIRQRRVRAVFSASYLFSFTMKQILAALQPPLSVELKNKLPTLSEEEIKNLPINENILLPHYDRSVQFAGCGLYPDRLIMIAKNPDADYDKLKTACRNAISHLAKAVPQHSLL